MLTEKEIKELREELATAKNPLFFYDDDPDGVCSFVLMYKIHREGKGIIVKSAPKLDSRLFYKVEENNPDKVFILDVPMVDQELVDKMKRPTFWIDHHGPFEVNGLKYYNPRLKDPSAYIPTTRMCYQVSGDKKNLWIATVGCLSDWYLPDFIGEFAKKYPKLLPDKKTTLEDAVYKHPIGKLVRIFSFILKGQTSEVNKSVKILTRIESPEEILNQETAQGKFLYRRYESINEKYQALIKEAKKSVTRSKLLLFNYSENKWSFTAELANELVNSLYPKKVVLIARRKSGEYKCSLRSKTNIADPLKKALEGIEGYGGGHENACGAVIKEECWEQFLKNLKREIKK
jgi:single-stranded DNA-specific DHH superfamily exonuclease